MIRIPSIYFPVRRGGGLEIAELDDFVDSGMQTVLVLTASLCVVGLSAATTLDELGSLADNLTGIETVVLDHVVGEHHAEHRLVMADRAHDSNEMLGNSLTELEDEVLGLCGLHGQYGCDDGDTVDLTDILQELLFGALHDLSLELLHVFLQRSILINKLLDSTLQVLGIVEHAADGMDGIFSCIDGILGHLACQRLHTPDAGSDTALGDNLKEADVSRALDMDTTAELSRRTEAYHTHPVAVFLTEEGHGTKLLSLLDRCIAMLVEGQVLTNHVVDDALHLTELLVGDFLKVVEVETQGLVVDIRAALLRLLTEDLLEGIVEEVGSGVVAG